MGQVETFEPTAGVQLAPMRECVCPHCTFVFKSSLDNPVCMMCGNPAKPRGTRAEPTPTDGEQDKALLARGRLLQLADVVQERLAAGDFSDPVDHFIRLRAAELDLQTCWEILEQFDQGAEDWLRNTHAYQLIKNPQVPPDSTSALLQPGDEEEKKEEDPEEIEKVIVPKC